MRAAIDCWSSIYRLIDLAMIIRRMDQDELIKASEKIKAAGMLRIMTIGGMLVEELLNVRFPDFLGTDDSFVLSLKLDYPHNRDVPRSQPQQNGVC